MFCYYLTLGFRSFLHNIGLTSLMVLTIGVGVGASMTTLTVYRGMAADPIPDKRFQLFAPQIDSWGPSTSGGVAEDTDHLQDQLSYSDALGLMNAQDGYRKAASYATDAALTPSDPQLMPFRVSLRATYADFFPMFEVPFLYGGPWNSTDDANHSQVVVITRELNEKLFDGANSLGKTLRLDDHEFRVVGVLKSWEPLPKFYDLTTSDHRYGKTEDAFVPFTSAIGLHMQTAGNDICPGTDVGSGWNGHLNSACVWIQLWVELSNASAVAHYRASLDRYAADQQRSGRFHWSPRTRLRNLEQWLVYQHVVSDEVRILVLVSFSFLVVCLLNTMGLMLARMMGRTAEVSVRRALGANRHTIILQFLTEAALVGLLGALLGVVLTILGLTGLRSVLSAQGRELMHLDVAGVIVAVLLAVTATVVAGLYPNWRAARVQPSWQLKAQ